MRLPLLEKASRLKASDKAGLSAQKFVAYSFIPTIADPAAWKVS